jgi:hypothetical protein
VCSLLGDLYHAVALGEHERLQLGVDLYVGPGLSGGTGDSRGGSISGMR